MFNFLSVRARCRDVQSKTRGVLLARFQITKHGSDRITLSRFDYEILDATPARRGEVQSGLVRLHFNNVLVGLDLFTGFDQK